MEATARADGVRIHVVQPPKAAVARTGLLDVGLSDAALAMTKGRQALTESFTAVPALPTPKPKTRRTPPEVMAVEVEQDETAPPQRLADNDDERSADDRWERERWARENAREAQRTRWERQRMIEEERQEQDALEQERLEQRRWRDARDEDPDGPPPPRGDDPPPRERW